VVTDLGSTNGCFLNGVRVVCSQVLRSGASVGSLRIRVLVSCARAPQRNGRRMGICGVAPAVAEVFDIVALEDLIALAKDMAAARDLVTA
jgi:anti-anti-sigma regulatory factor